MPEQATDRVMVHASAQRCYEVATTFEEYADFSDHLQRVDVLRRDADGRATLVAYEATAMGRTTNYALRYDYALAPKQVSWVLAEGDIQRRLDGTYFFEALTDDETEVTFHLVVELRTPLPGFLRRRAEQRILRSALQELKVRAER